MDSGSQRTFHLLRHLAARADVRLLDIAPDPSEPDTSQAWSYQHEGRVLPDIPAAWRCLAPDLWAERCTPVADAYVRRAAIEDIDLLIFASWPLIPSRKAGAPSPRVVWDGDSHSSYHATRAAAASVPPARRAHSTWLSRRYARLERRLSDVADAVTLAGPLDVHPFAAWRPGLARWIPNEVTQVEPRPLHPHFDFGFLGSNWPPNADGMRWFVRRVWPEVLRQRPQSTLAVAGNIRVDPMHGVTALGRVDDKADFYAQVSGIVVPVDYGSGTQQKLLETIDLEVPVYTSRYGQRSTLLDHLTVLDAEDDWVRGLVRHLDGHRPARLASIAQTAEAAVDQLLEDLR